MKQFLGMLLGPLGASWLGNLLTCKVSKQSKVPGRRVIRGDEQNRAGGDF